MPKYQHAQPFDIIRVIQNIQKQLMGLSIQDPGLQDPWHYVGDPTTGLGTTFGSGWTNTGAPWCLTAFRLVFPNSVEIRGRVAPGAVSTTVFTLPTGYIPKSQQSIPYFVVSGMTAYPANSPLLNVLSTGAVVQNGVASPASTGAWFAGTISLDI